MAFETAAIVRLYGEIDRKVNADQGVRDEVGQFLSPYHRNPALHWYDDYLEWLGGAPPEGENALPRAGTCTDRPRWRHQDIVEPRRHARRMFAIAALARAFPEMKARGEASSANSHAALRSPKIRGQAELLYARLAGIEPIHIDGRCSWFRARRNGGKQIVALKEPQPTGTQFKPCAGRWVRVPGMEGPVDAVRTNTVKLEGVDLEHAAKFLDPENWPKCSDFWCKMERVEEPAAGQARYLEVVSTQPRRRPPPEFAPRVPGRDRTPVQFHVDPGPDGNEPRLSPTTGWSRSSVRG